MSAKQNCCLIYRPVMDYEESETAYFVCSSNEVANECVRVMRAFMERLLKRLPKYPDDDESDVEWENTDTKRRAILAKTRWPFGVDLSSEIRFSTNEWDSSSLAVRELPFYT